MDLNLLNWLKDSKYRVKVLELLKTQPHLSSELATKLDINRASMSRVLRGLKLKGLVKSYSDKARTVTYSLSEKGKEIIKARKND